MTVGEYVSEMTGLMGNRDYNSDLCLDDDILMVAKYGGKCIEYYKLVTE